MVSNGFPNSSEGSLGGYFFSCPWRNVAVMCILYSWVTLAFVDLEKPSLQVLLVFEVF